MITVRRQLFMVVALAALNAGHPTLAGRPSNGELAGVGGRTEALLASTSKVPHSSELDCERQRLGQVCPLAVGVLGLWWDTEWGVAFSGGAAGTLAAWCAGWLLWLVWRGTMRRKGKGWPAGKALLLAMCLLIGATEVLYAHSIGAELPNEGCAGGAPGRVNSSADAMGREIAAIDVGQLLGGNEPGEFGRMRSVAIAILASVAKNSEAFLAAVGHRLTAVDMDADDSFGTQKSCGHPCGKRNAYDGAPGGGALNGVRSLAECPLNGIGLRLRNSLEETEHCKQVSGVVGITSMVCVGHAESMMGREGVGRSVTNMLRGYPEKGGPRERELSTSDTLQASTAMGEEGKGTAMASMMLVERARFVVMGRATESMCNEKCDMVIKAHDAENRWMCRNRQLLNAA